MTMLIHKDNFYENTNATFEYKGVSLEKLLEDYGQPNYCSVYGSQYWYLEDRVIRWSDHWGKVKDCKWAMSKEMKFYKSSVRGGFIAGVCLFVNFERQT